MPETVTVTYTIYQYDELSDEAKQTARAWYAEATASDFADFVSYDDFLEIAATLGVTVGEVTDRYRTFKGEDRTRQVPAIYWSGFSSQGDGASFAGAFKADGKAGEKVRAYAPQDETLHRLADRLDALAAKYPAGLEAAITIDRGAHYSHSGTMAVDARTLDDDPASDNRGDEIEIAEPDQRELTDTLRGLADWFYRYLETEYDDRQSDEQVEESIRANEYTFDETGKRKD